MKTMALVLHPNGSVEETGSIGLEDLQNLVGGYIEGLPVPGRPDMTAYINEAGKLDGLAMNPLATKLMSQSLFEGDWVSGSIVFCGFDEESGEILPIPDDWAGMLGAWLEDDAPANPAPFANTEVHG